MSTETEQLPNKIKGLLILGIFVVSLIWDWWSQGAFTIRTVIGSIIFTVIMSLLIFGWDAVRSRRKKTDTDDRSF